uniref:Uncharacterized protein n=1 Tax=Taeniopygia guttata TaxID=59729 RepID=A0A674H5Q1_TAEGU
MALLWGLEWDHARGEEWEFIWRVRKRQERLKESGTAFLHLSVMRVTHTRASVQETGACTDLCVHRAGRGNLVQKAKV